MIQLQALAFGPFAEVEPLNPRFIVGRPKLRVTVDTEVKPHVPERQLLDALQRAFPGIARHGCEMQRGTSPGGATPTGIVLLDGEPTANQAHLLEHLMLEYLSALDHASRLSGVTCAYESPPERNDVFVECGGAEVGSVAALLAIDTLNAALSDRPLGPLYPDALLGASLLIHGASANRLTPAQLARRAGIPRERAAAALDLLGGAGVAETEKYAMNFSGEVPYRLSPAPASEIARGTEARARGPGDTSS